MTKEDLQEKLVARYEAVGIKMSKEMAWKAFREGIYAVADTLLSNPEDNLALSGVGRFEILKAAPRKSKIGLVEYIPRLRFRTSTRINAFLETSMGQVPDPAKLEAAKAKIRAEGGVPNFGPRVAKAKPDVVAEPFSKVEAAKAAAAKAAAKPAAAKAAAKPATKSAPAAPAPAAPVADDFD